ncbi:MAG: arginine--tRNA ligase [Deltaproteobacteria bacterium]|nr:arginine--tRNA ligase [Deltaproteobacteria bacterium]
MKEKLNNLLKNTINYCFEQGLLKDTPLPEYVIEVPNNRDHGHLATNLPMILASSQKRAPRDIAKVISDSFRDPEGFLEKIEIAGPGFINFTLNSIEWLKSLKEIIELDEKFGAAASRKGEGVLVEFVSANPTGPLHLGHGRGAALGDTICRVLDFRGYDVVREFYINDAGVQIRLLGESIYARYKQMNNPDHPFPEKGYHGEYIIDLAKEISAEKDLSSMDEETAIMTCSEIGKEKMLLEIKKDLEQFRVEFDLWFNESSLFDKGLVSRSLEEMKAKDELYEKDGALWIKTAGYGDDKDRVIKKQDGQYTYFASDIAYHLDKHRRGFSRALNLWGADHHGYINRVKSALMANGIDENWLSVLLIQLVKLWKEGQEIRMSKRAGQYVTMKDLLEEVDVDAARFVFLTKTHDSALDFDIDLVKKHDNDNPVYYVQYAHARICSIFRKAQEEGVDITLNITERDLTRLSLDEEVDIIRHLEGFTELLDGICKTFEAHRLTYYLTDLAALFHRYFNLGIKDGGNRIITDDLSLTRARLALVAGVRIVIRNGLKLLGVNAPEKM